MQPRRDQARTLVAAHHHLLFRTWESVEFPSKHSTQECREARYMVTRPVPAPTAEEAQEEREGQVARVLMVR